jgi:NADPH-dependent curcumin reductase CurA
METPQQRKQRQWQQRQRQQTMENSNSIVVLKNHRILLVRRPDGLPRPVDFQLEVTDLVVRSAHFCPHNNSNINSNSNSNINRNSNINSNINSNSNSKRAATTTNTDLVLETLYVSIDPAMRGWMSSARSYLPPVELGSVMRASTISRVIAASSSDTDTDALSTSFPIGAIVRSEIVGVQSYCVVKNCTISKARKLFTRLDHTGIIQIPPPNTNTGRLSHTTTTNHHNSNNKNNHNHKLSYASFLGVLGTTGMTAYFGLLRVGKPKPSDIVLISGAAGATGSIVAQIAKHVIGCHTVIGTAGSDAKCEWLESNGIVDVAINYKKKTPSLAKAIARACRGNNNNKKGGGVGGVDLVFDNVGSGFLEAALSNLARGARIVLCGAISQYNVSSSSSNKNNNDAISIPSGGPRNYMNLLVNRATMTGFVVFDYQNNYPTAQYDLVQWIAAGKIRCYEEDMKHVGIDQFYPALLSLFEGTNVGKVVLKAKPPESEDVLAANPRSRI